MTRDDIDHLWQKALRESVEAGEQYTRYNFAALVAAAEREACARVCDDGLPIASSLNALDDMEMWGEKFAAAIRARGQA